MQPRKNNLDINRLMDLSKTVFVLGNGLHSIVMHENLRRVHLINFNKESIIVSGDSL